VARARLGVVALVPPPLDCEVDALRLALADPARGRIPAHVTLVPPVNVELDRVPEALSLLRRAASAARPFTLELGPVTSFAPESPTLYLACADGSDALAALRAALWSAPLARPVGRDFVAHVTVCDQASPELAEAGPVVLAGYRAVVRIERIHLLSQGDGRRWRPVADAWLGAGGIVGRGGLEVELAPASLADPEVRTWCDRWSEGRVAPGSDGSAAPGGVGIWLAARREDRVVGVASGRLDAAGVLAALAGARARTRTIVDAEVAAVLEWLGVERDARHQGIGGLLVEGFLDAARRVGAGTVLAGAELPVDVEALCRRRGLAPVGRSAP
jgi:2'-5' RNA ligase